MYRKLPLFLQKLLTGICMNFYQQVFLILFLFFRGRWDDRSQSELLKYLSRYMVFSGENKQQILDKQLLTSFIFEPTFKYVIA